MALNKGSVLFYNFAAVKVTIKKDKNRLKDMKKAFGTLAIIFALLLTAGSINTAQAQRRVVRYLANYENEPYHFGFLLGFNSMMYTIDAKENYQFTQYQPNQWPNGPINPDSTNYLRVYNLETHKVPGFTVGIIGSKRMGKYFDLRFIPTLSFGSRKLSYDIAVNRTNGQTVIKSLDKEIQTVFLEFPWHVKYRSKRLNNIGAYLIGGVNPRLDLASQKQSIDPGTGETTNFVTKRFDCALEVGTGFDFYNQWFKMGIELKMSYGMMDVIKNEAFIYTAPIENLKNKMFQISMTFE